MNIKRRSAYTTILALAVAVLTLAAPNAWAGAKCKAGTKPGKTAASLKAGDKVGCYNVKKAAQGKTLLTADKTKACFACHSLTGSVPPAQVLANLRDQGYSLVPAKIVAAFQAHTAEMGNSTLNTSQAVLIGQYLQSIK